MSPCFKLINKPMAKFRDCHFEHWVQKWGHKSLLVAVIVVLVARQFLWFMFLFFCQSPTIISPFFSFWPHPLCRYHQHPQAWRAPVPWKSSVPYDHIKLPCSPNIGPPPEIPSAHQLTSSFSSEIWYQAAWHPFCTPPIPHLNLLKNK